MIGDHAVGGAVLSRRVAVGTIGDGVNQGCEQVGVVIVMLVLHDSSDALEPHAGVDGGAWQIDALVYRALFVLHEDEVPDLHVTVAVLVRRAGWAAGYARAVVVKNFRAGAAGAGIAHSPKVIGGGDADDTPFRQARDLAPNVVGLIVSVVDCGPEAILVEAIVARHQVPGQLDGEIFEIVAERKISHHLEEGVVAGSEADIVEVIMLAAGTHAFLARGGAAVVAMLDACEGVLELHHAGIGEEQGRVVVWHQRS